MANNANTSDERIAPWFAGRSILITGCTGFVGKALLEKLLRSCPDVKNIYVLIRHIRGTPPADRLRQLLAQPIFDRLRKDNPCSFNKIICVRGDLSLPSMNMPMCEREAILANVSVVFHCAGSVALHLSVKEAVRINVLGTKCVLRLCNEMSKLKACVYLSTVHSYGERNVVLETVYMPAGFPSKVTETIMNMDDESAQNIMGLIIGPKPNTYAFSKALTEHMIMKEAPHLPITIVRGSLITAALNEPMPGWIDNANGATGIIVAQAKGMLRSLLGRTDFTADIVPVDIYVNCLITAAWNTGISGSKPRHICIYNCTTGNLNPITWGDFDMYVPHYARKYPMDDVMWYPIGGFRHSTTINNICIKLFHTVPAYMLDLVQVSRGKVPYMVNGQNKLRERTREFEYYTMREWEFDNKNFVRLLARLNKEDKKTFDFDVAAIRWSLYLENYVKGARKFLLKQQDKDIEKARKKMRRMFIAHRLCQFIAVGLAFCLVFHPKLIFGSRMIDAIKDYYSSFNVVTENWSNELTKFVRYTCH